MFFRQFAITALVALIAAVPADAARLKTWQVQTQAQYADARFENAVVSDQGAVQLARLLEPLAPSKIDAAQVWDMVEDKDGALIVATGGDGKLLKVTRAGDVTVLYEHKAGPILSLAAGPDGSVFAGTGPDGMILEVSAQGEVKPFAETYENYIWALVYNPRAKALFAATGPKGRIVTISPDGKVETFFQTKQEHILCLAGGEGDTLYAGTDKQGLVYRIDGKSKGFVLYQTPQGEVRSLLATPTAVYAGTAAPTKKRGQASTGAGSLATAVSVLKEEPSHGGKSAGRAAAPAPPAGGENSVYRISPEGAVREIFRDKAQMLTLLKLGDQLLVGSGMDGRLYAVDETSREFAEIARPDVGQIMRLLRRADGGIVIGTADSGHVFTMQDRVASRGSVLSEVFDAKLSSKWGAFTWRADTPGGSALSIAVRGGNTSEPDAHWSDWSNEFNDPAAAVFQGPDCRFAQFRVTMKSGRGRTSPILHSVSLRYATANQAPEVTSLETPDLDAAPLKEPKKLKIKWTATDANEDELNFDIWVRKDGWSDWVRIEEAWAKTEYEWDTAATPSGIYRVKIVASDKADNPGDEALTGSRISAPVLVAHEPPRVTLKLVSREEGKAALEATATAPLARLVGAAYAVDGKSWINVSPVGGLFDGREKTFRFQVEPIGPGAHVIVFKVNDTAANVGTADVFVTASSEK